MGYDAVGKVYIPLEELQALYEKYCPALKGADYIRLGNPSTVGDELVVDYAVSSECDPRDWSVPPEFLKKKADAVLEKSSELYARDHEDDCECGCQDARLAEKYHDEHACPGCGCLPGEGVTAGCTDPTGCGYHDRVGKDYDRELELERKSDKDDIPF